MTEETVLVFSCSASSSPLPSGAVAELQIASSEPAIPDPEDKQVQAWIKTLSSSAVDTLADCSNQLGSTLCYCVIIGSANECFSNL